jgi:hypothetical protein
MLLFEGHYRRRRLRIFVLIVVYNELVRLRMMPSLLLHFNARLPLRVLFEAILIRPPFLCLRIIIEFWLIAVYALKLFAILLSQALKHVLFSFILDLTNGFARTLITPKA